MAMEFRAASFRLSAHSVESGNASPEAASVVIITPEAPEHWSCIAVDAVATIGVTALVCWVVASLFGVV